jgi:hypothetical protein
VSGTAGFRAISRLIDPARSTVLGYAEPVYRWRPARLPVSASQFIADLVSSLAWPALIVVIVLIFRRQFGTMLGRLAHVRIGSGGSESELDWNQTEAVIRQSVAAARRPEIGPGAATPTGGGRPLGSQPLGSSQPPGAPRAGGVPPSGDRTPQTLIEDRWQALAEELRAVVRPSGSLGESELSRAEFDQLMDVALRAGLLDAAAVRSLDGLRHLRNLARTATGLTQRQAEEFTVLADAVSYSMRRDMRSPVWPAN